MADENDKRKLIAIVEDDLALVDLFRDALEYLGDWQLRFFTDGQDAKDTLPGLQADLILLDIGLPNLDGVSLYKILRGHIHTRQTPIIVITGSRDWELHRLGLQAGLLLYKPFHMQELITMITALLTGEKEG